MLGRYHVTIFRSLSIQCLLVLFHWEYWFANVFGSFLMGAFVELSGKLFEVNEVTRLFVVTGFLGAFTTFSTFSLETVALLHRGQLGLALLYVLVSVCVSVIALYFGMFLFRGL